MAGRKTASPEIVETAEKKLPVRKVITPQREAVCGECGVPLVSFDGRRKCKFCWNCGREVKWR